MMFLNTAGKVVTKKSRDQVVFQRSKRSAVIFPFQLQLFFFPEPIFPKGVINDQESCRVATFSHFLVHGLTLCLEIDFKNL